MKIHLLYYIEYGIPYTIIKNPKNIIGSLLKSFENNLNQLEYYLSREKTINYNDNLSNIMSEVLPKKSKIALLFSGGMDSTLIARLLKNNDNLVTGIFIGDRFNLDTSQAHLNKIGLDELIIVDEVAEPDEVLKLLGDLPVGGTNLLGLSKLDKFVRIENFDSIIHGQGADTLSNVVHNQRFKSRFVFVNILLHLLFIIRKKNWIFTILPLVFISLRIRKIFLKNSISSYKEIHFYLGVFITHIPIDGGAINQFSKIYNVEIKSPFHDLKVLDYFLHRQHDTAQKIEIYQALDYLNMGNEIYSRGGFTGKTIKDLYGRKVTGFKLRSYFSKEFLSCYLN